MAVELVALVMDSGSPTDLGKFWARALRWAVRHPAAGDLELVPTDPTSFRLVFRGGAEAKVRDGGGHRCPGAVSFADVDGNEVCLVE